MTVRIPSLRARALIFSALLLIGQALLLQHQADLAQHANGDHCEWCLTHSPLAGAVPAGDLPLPPRFTAAGPMPVFTLPAIRTRAPTAYSSRAPPQMLPA